MNTDALRSLDDSAITGTKEVDIRDMHMCQPEVRRFCESDGCGHYGKNWMCPPAAGTFEACSAAVSRFDRMLVVSTLYPLKGKATEEQVRDALGRHQQIIRNIRDELRSKGLTCLVLGAGECVLCPRCAKMDGLPCRHPYQAISSMEAYGIDVLGLLERIGMPRGRKEDGLTFFGAVLYD
jgi:predicted metal-binding protein